MLSNIVQQLMKKQTNTLNSKLVMITWAKLLQHQRLDAHSIFNKTLKLWKQTKNCTNILEGLIKLWESRSF